MGWQAICTWTKIAQSPMALTFQGIPEVPSNDLDPSLKGEVKPEWWLPEAWAHDINFYQVVAIFYKYLMNFVTL